MPGRTRPALTAVALGAIALVVVPVVLLLRERDRVPAPTSPATSVITAHAEELRTVPEVGAKRRDAAGSELGSALDRFYTQAFTGTLETTPATSSPSIARGLKDLMTPAAVEAVKAKPDVFDIGDLIVTSGDVRFTGVVTYVDHAASESLVQIDFVGRAVPAGLSSPVARVHQTGTLGLKRTSGRWLVESFDLRLSTSPEATPPRVTPPVVTPKV